ncbi:hypothetical protein [Methylobacterium sp. ID0610]|uniref:hypothetical protein n=1 Tax=Methylobacterium carpenticola TaxID=3344827 RepID=UPI0036C7F792
MVLIVVMLLMARGLRTVFERVEAETALMLLAGLGAAVLAGDLLTRTTAWRSRNGRG